MFIHILYQVTIVEYKGEKFYSDFNIFHVTFYMKLTT